MKVTAEGGDLVAEKRAVRKCQDVELTFSLKFSPPGLCHVRALLSLDLQGVSTVSGNQHLKILQGRNKNRL